VLGEAHPIARAASARDVLRRQSAVIGGLVPVLAVAAWADDDAVGQVLISTVAVVEMWLLAALTMATACLRDRARDAISDGAPSLHVTEIAKEYARLGTSRYRAGLADRLAAAEHAGKHWHELGISTRPPPSVCNLADHAATTTEIATLVRDPGACLRGVALLDRLLRGGYAAPLYADPIDDVARELGRIRFLLAAAQDVAAIRDPAVVV
jgi:hypothetical protein